jgi:hypothetical protein
MTCGIRISNTVADFFLDANIGSRLAPILIRLGHTAVTTNEASRHDANDDEQLILATELGRILITHDQRDFELLFRAWVSFSRRWGVEPGLHAGVIVLPQELILPYTRAASEIVTLLHSHHDLRGHLCDYDMKWGWQVQRF